MPFGSNVVQAGLGGSARMKMNIKENFHKKSKRLLILSAVLYMTVLAGLAVFAPSGFWFTPDQQGRKLYDKGLFKDAAQRFSNPDFQGAAWYRAGEFESAARAFSRMNTPEAHFNRGNALLMGGKYGDAVEAYERALKLKPGWGEAKENLEIAKLRAERMQHEGGNMTGGMLGADEIVVDSGKRKQGKGETVETEGGKALSDQELQALWLRRVQTKPADFMRAKFAFQLLNQTAPAETGENK